MNRRELLASALFGTAAAGLVRPARAGFPDHPMRIIVAYSPGGPTDILARLFAEKLSGLYGIRAIVENKPGASTLIGLEAVAKALPDGHTLLLATSTMGFLTFRKQGTPIDVRKDLRPVGMVAESEMVILANNQAPFGTLQELIAYGRANPGKINYATNGIGAATHLAGELFSSMAGITMTAIPYKGSGEAVVAVLTGQVDCSFDGIGPTNAQIRSGRLRLLATSGTKRSSTFPDTPTVAEFVPGYTASGPYGLMAPRDVPDGAVLELNRAIRTIIDMPDVRARYHDLSFEPRSSSPDEYGKLIGDDIEKWGNLVRERQLVIE